MSSPNSEKCTCDDSPPDSDSTNGDSTSPKSTNKPTTRSLTSFFKRRGRSLIGKNGKHTTSSSSSSSQVCDGTGCCGMTSTGVHESERRSQKWLPGRRKTKATQIGCCCACYRRNEENVVPGGEARRVSSEDVVQEVAKAGENGVPEVNAGDDETPHVVIENVAGELRREDMVFFSQRFMPNVHFTGVFFSPRSLEDVEEEARIERAREIERGVDPPPSFRPPKRIQVLCNDVIDQEPQRFQLICPADVTIENLKVLFPNVHIQAARLDNAGCHTQIDFIHCLVPDLLNITNCSFYWGKMDRYEAERLLDGKREGTFLLRDSAQEEFLFSVSFRKYGRSLHARIEQWNHRFSFDSHDPGVYTSDTVCGLIEHYKDPSSCMFFEPMLTWPLHRNTVFSLQHLCRATIASKLSYDDIRHLQLPKSLKLYLKEYHYRQKVRVARFDEDLPSIDIRNTSNLPFHAK